MASNPEPKKPVCPTCDGSGKDDSRHRLMIGGVDRGVMPCPTCHGSGTIAAPRKDKNDD